MEIWIHKPPPSSRSCWPNCESTIQKPRPWKPILWNTSLKNKTCMDLFLFLILLSVDTFLGSYTFRTHNIHDLYFPSTPFPGIPLTWKGNGKTSDRWVPSALTDCAISKVWAKATGDNFVARMYTPSWGWCEDAATAAPGNELESKGLRGIPLNKTMQYKIKCIGMWPWWWLLLLLMTGRGVFYLKLYWL